jgi:hypothetical protein
VLDSKSKTIINFFSQIWSDQGTFHCRIVLDRLRILPNGPAIKGGCVTRRQHRAASRYFRQKTVTVQGGYGTRFCRPGTNIIEHYDCRGTRLISGREFVSIAEN